MQANDLPMQENLRNPWRARLLLRYAEAAGRSVLALREHEGPLAVQKSLYPEGEGICHNFVLHPPAGMAGGDELAVEAELGERAHALLSTPGAGKWYRSAGALAQQSLCFRLAEDAKLEWLPAETIVFSGAQAQLRTRIDLARGAAYLGWEILCMGRTASGESFTTGQLRQHIEIRREGRLLWQERGALHGADPLLHSPIGLRGHPVAGTMVAVAAVPHSDESLRALRAIETRGGFAGVTRLGESLLLRYLGSSALAGRDYFAAARELLRPQLFHVPAAPLRIWQT
jgi:urease accessory protein